MLLRSYKFLKLADASAESGELTALHKPHVIFFVEVDSKVDEASQQH